MTLRVVQVPSPAAGHDWSYTVPGPYIFDVLAAAATLTVPANPTVAVDASPNSHPGTYFSDSHITYGVAGPFPGVPNLAVNVSTGVLSIYIAENLNTDGAYDLATFSVDALVNSAGLGNASMSEIAAVRTGDINHPADLRWIYGVTDSGTQRIANTNVNVFSLPGVAITNGTWAHVGFSYDGAQWVGYRNGVAGTAVAGNPPGTVTRKPYTIGGDLLSTQDWTGSIAAVAVYAGVLPASRFLAHSNAVATSADFYRSAVLADNPVSLWMLEEQTGPRTRTVDLVVTDGTHTVDDIPSGFPSKLVSSAVSYTWQSRLASGIQIPAGTTTVGIPQLILPTGYAIGSRTLDLGPTDQWSNISLWWDDAYQQAFNPLNAYDFPGGIRLHYTQEVFAP